MTYKEKDKLLSYYEEMPLLDEKHYTMLVNLSKDKDNGIRARVAALLINFEDQSTKEVLLRLAHDEDALVRTEAYDSLRVFNEEEVETFLEKAIKIETDEIACFYAILSWSDVVKVLYDDCSLKRNQIECFQKLPLVQGSEHCLLGCYYAKYCFGEEKMIEKIVALCQSSNYLVRCAVINTLNEIINKDNEKIAKCSVECMLVDEKNYAVISAAKKFLRRNKNC